MIIKLFISFRLLLAVSNSPSIYDITDWQNWWLGTFCNSGVSFLLLTKLLHRTRRRTQTSPAHIYESYIVEWRPLIVSASRDLACFLMMSATRLGGILDFVIWGYSGTPRLVGRHSLFPRVNKRKKRLPTTRNLKAIQGVFHYRIMEKSKLPSNDDYLDVSQANEVHFFRIKHINDEPSTMGAVHK
ncbi:hypothetical protein AVEN_205760-1 [Araneus ventricosus]|uniref:Uncharacterized protein n=1 Tax=Araneus ventricosus TaxID=182803 RepID=A0A4Y2SLI3_ARAVE|nr:hypothetical protein AVEN_205760-1 [Araneus ventricosus]